MRLTAGDQASRSRGATGEVGQVVEAASLYFALRKKGYSVWRGPVPIILPSLVGRASVSGWPQTSMRNHFTTYLPILYLHP